MLIKNKELHEIFEYKHALEERIARGKKEIERINVLAEIEKDAKTQTEMYTEVRRGESILSPLITERLKLSREKIANQLNLKPHAVCYQERLYLSAVR